MDEPRIIIVANRLPLRARVSKEKEEWELVESEGGLATGLNSVYKHQNNIWIGWPGAHINDKAAREEISAALESRRFIPAWLSLDEIKHFYEGLSNETLWPLFHYFVSFAKFDTRDWQVYKEVNQKFADIIISCAGKDDVIWIHDYHLMLVPGMVREKLPGATIGFFQHIPFPSYELFRTLPWKAELLNGLSGADLIGFHTEEDVQHFISSASNILHYASKENELISEERTLLAKAFPMGIDYEKYHRAALSKKTKMVRAEIDPLVKNKKLLLSIDRLDYSKGIIQRLLAYKTFLKNYPGYKEKVTFLQLIVPSRDKVKQYALLKKEIDTLVSEINGEHGTLTWQPIHYLYRSCPLEMIAALYAAADIALVTPLRDGMNLVCKEFVASKTDKSGVLILSEMAGASKELKEALLVNPHDEGQVAAAIAEALSMPLEEQVRKMKVMQQHIRVFNINYWVRNFLGHLNEVKTSRKNISIKLPLKPPVTEKNVPFFEATPMLFPDAALKSFPNEELRSLLFYLYQQAKNKEVLIEDRKLAMLENWFNGEANGLIAV